MNDSTLVLNNATNNSGYYCKYDEPESDLLRKAKLIGWILLIALGLAGNIFVIVLAMKYTLRKNLHHLIINMAVSDSLFVFMKMLLEINWITDSKLLLTYPDGILGDILCNAAHILYQVSLRVSLVTLLLISIERFKATRQTLKRSRPYTFRQRVLIVVGVCWLIPMVMNTYMLNNFTVDPESGTCRFVDGTKYFHYLYMVAAFFDIIFTIMILVFSILTIKRLSRTQAIQAHFNQKQQKARARRIRSAVRMVLASVLLYACCWFPGFAYKFVYEIHLIFPTLPIFPLCMDQRTIDFMMYRFSPLFNSCFSPCIYIIFLSDFREAARKVLSCRKNNRHENRRNSMELQPMGNIESGGRRRRRYSNDEDEQEVQHLSSGSTGIYTISVQTGKTFA